MDAATLLLSRSSNGKLTEPAPDASSLELAFQAAMRAPDHGLLHPYRFHVVRGDARHTLGELLGRCARRADPGASPETLAAAAEKALRAPMIIVVSARVLAHPKAPVVEQLLCAGAAAQNVLLALHARGYAGIWRTGAPAYDQEVKAAFGLGTDDALLGFLYVGTAAQPPPDIKRPDPQDHVFEWTRPLD